MTSVNYYGAELMVYFEKHKFLEILRVLLVQISLDRPYCIKHYLRRNLRKIANSVLRTNTIIHLPLKFDVGAFVANCLKKYNIPTFTYNVGDIPLSQCKLEHLLRQFDKFCSRNGLQKKNRIYLNFPLNFNGALTLQNSKTPPTNFIHVTDCKKHSENYTDLLKYYSCNLNRLTVHVDSNKKDAEKAVLPEIFYKIKHAPKYDPLDMGGRFVYRAVIMGRPGCGKGTQARLLAKRYDLVYIDMALLAKEALYKKDRLSRALCVKYKNEKKYTSSALIAVLWKRLLQKDALTKGWVIVGFPNNLLELQALVEDYQTPPNRFVILHCSKKVALLRCVKRWENDLLHTNCQETTIFNMKNEFKKFEEAIVEIYKYLKKCPIKTIHVNSNRPYGAVANTVQSLLER